MIYSSLAHEQFLIFLVYIYDFLEIPPHRYSEAGSSFSKVTKKVSKHEKYRFIFFLLSNFTHELQQNLHFCFPKKNFIFFKFSETCEKESARSIEVFQVSDSTLWPLCRLIDLCAVSSPYELWHAKIRAAKLFFVSHCSIRPDLNVALFLLP